MLMETNERAPLLNYADFSAILDDEAEDLGVDDDTSEGKREWDAMNAAGDAIRNFYEAKITSGELAVVKTARIVRRECIRPFASGPVSDVAFECSECGTEATSSRNIFCSVCGARIVE